MNKIRQEIIDKSVKIIGEEDYLSLNGASKASLGDAGLHKANTRISKKQWNRLIDAQSKRDEKLLERREELRKEYREKVNSGEIRPPTRLEKLKAMSSGHPDNESVRAARRILANHYNIIYEEEDNV